MPLHGTPPTHTCKYCGAAFTPFPNVRGRFCSHPCYCAWKGHPDRFWEQVDKNGPVPPHCPELGPCWPWIGYINPKTGYGKWKSGGSGAHRDSYVMAYGPLRPGQQVLHRCDVRACVRPTHLFAGTHKDNMADMAQKGRAARGVRNAAAKLTEANVLYILAEWKRDGCGIRRMAREFGVDKKVVSDIVRGRGWKHLQQPST